MPLFDYYCPACQTQEERMVRKWDDPQTCQCGSEMAKRPSSPCFILKGAGFYSNGTFAKAKEGPKIDKELLTLSDRDLNVELGLPPDLP